MLEKLKDEAKGFVHSAQIRWRVQVAERALGDSEFERGAETLLRLLSYATQLELSVAAWRELVQLTIEAAIRANNNAQIAEVFDQYIWLAWSGKVAGSQPWPLAGAFSIAEKMRHWRAGAHLADMVARVYPTIPLGPYAAAHFRELQGIEQGNLNAKELGAIASRFERARASATATQRPGLARHCDLRRAVLLLRANTSKQEGRALLRALDKQGLPPSEQLWYALGMSHSDFWLDRVRAADALDDLATSVIENRPGPTARELHTSQIEGATSYLLEREGITLQSAEEDRLHALIELVFKNTPLADALLEVLELRLAMQEHADKPLDQAGALFSKIEQRSGGQTARWGASIATARAVIEAANDTPARQPHTSTQPWLAPSHQVIDALVSLHTGATDQLETDLAKLRSTFLRARELHPEPLKPIAVLLPPLLGWFKKNSPKKLRGKTLEDLPPEERQAREQFSRLQELVISLVCHWAPIATKPGYGWWELAAHLTGANLNPAAAAVTTRALSSYGEPSTATRDFVMGKLLTWAVKQEDRVVMLRWLEHGERIYGA